MRNKQNKQNNRLTDKQRNGITEQVGVNMAEGFGPINPLSVCPLICSSVFFKKSVREFGFVVHISEIHNDNYIV